jgi:hypothetical protein
MFFFSFAFRSFSFSLRTIIGQSHARTHARTRMSFEFFFLAGSIFFFFKGIFLLEPQ